MPRKTTNHAKRIVKRKRTRQAHWLQFGFHHGTYVVVLFVLLFGVIGGFVVGFSRAATTTSPYVSRVGQQLYLNGSTYRMVGFDMWRANVSFSLPNTGYLVNNGNTLNQSLVDMHATGPKINTFRAWFLQQEVTPTASGYNWAPFDKTLQVAAQNGYKVIPVLADNWNYEGPPQKNYTWYKSGYETVVNRGTANGVAYNENVNYLQYVKDVVNRYKNNTAIAAWEMINEPDDRQSTGTCSTDAAQVMLNFTNTVGSAIRSIDPNHLVSLGAAGNGNCGTINGDYQTVMGSKYIDLCSFHDYEGATNATAYNQYNGLNVRISQCAALNKPVYIGESGVHLNDPAVGGSLATRANLLQAKMKAAFGMRGVVGYLPWQFDDRAGATSIDDYSYDPGDPAIPVVSGYGL